MVENNCITINFPQGSGGHVAGRILASADNVKWYDHSKNGEYPWIPYTIGNDLGFSELHFNKRFAGALGTGVCNKTVPPVLDMGDKQGYPYTKDEIMSWKEKVYPMNLLYTLHANLDVTKDFFKPSKHLVIIPTDVNILIDRWFATSAHYYYDPRQKDRTCEDIYRDRAIKENKDIRECLEEDFNLQIKNYKKYTTDNDFVVEEVNDMLDRDYFLEVCKKLDLDFNASSYNKTIEIVKTYSHLN